MLDSNEALKKAGNMKGESFRKGLRDGIPIALGYFACVFYVWYDGSGRRTEYLAGSTDFSD